jgi:hypothetical protein
MQMSKGQIWQQQARIITILRVSGGIITAMNETTHQIRTQAAAATAPSAAQNLGLLFGMPPAKA